MERQLPKYVILVAGLVMLIEGFFKIPLISGWAAQLRNWNIIIAAFALGLGAINLILLHSRRVAEWDPGRSINSLALLFGIVLFGGFGIIKGVTFPSFQKLYDSTLVPMNTAMFGTLIFFIVSAAYRAFVVRRAEAAVILITAVLVMLSQVPLGEALFPQSVKIAQWLTNIPNNAGQRGLIICAAFGALANSLRVLAGIQRTS